MGESESYGSRILLDQLTVIVLLFALYFAAIGVTLAKEIRRQHVVAVLQT